MSVVSFPSVGSKPRVIACDEFTADLPEAEWLIDDIFERDSLVTLFGPSNEGKTFVALSMAMAIATGTPWLGRRVTKGPVLYAVGEGRRGMARRTAGWKKYHDISSVTGMHFYDAAPQLRNPKELDDFIKQLKAIQPSLVIIDTLATSISGDENSSEDMSQFVAALKRIQRELGGATVMVIHHVPLSAGKGKGPNKQPMRERGHTSLRGAMDTSLLSREETGSFGWNASNRKTTRGSSPFLSPPSR